MSRYAYSGRWSPPVIAAQNRARRAQRECRCATDPENAPCAQCEAEAWLDEPRPGDGPELAPDEPWEAGEYMRLEYGPEPDAP